MAKKKLPQDPFVERESQKYDNPIPSREFILDQLEQLERPVTREELAERFKLTDPEQQEALRRRLRAMERDGQIVMGRKRRYGLVNQMDLICGLVQAHRDGYGFVVREDSGPDLFLSAREMRTLFHGDSVLVRIVNPQANKNRQEASVVRILERAVEEVAGRLSTESGVAFVISDDRRIQDVSIPLDKLAGAKDGQIVLARITQYPTFRTHPVGEITEVLGDHMAPGMEINLAIRSHGLPHEFPKQVVEESETFPQKVLPSDLKGRKDLRDLSFITIDGKDAKDFDDAVYCEETAKGWVLYVAIADVSYYVKPDMALDEEAEKRGNSVYFPGNVIPMLPECLSNGLCSLKPNVDRLVLVCRMLISPTGSISRPRFFDAVIRSHQRFIYDDVTAILQGDNTLKTKHETFLPLLNRLHDVFNVLAAKRAERGAIEFESVETRIVFGENRKIKKIVPVVQTVAHRIIEECMLAANVSAAKFMQKASAPAIYRVHPVPTLDDVESVRLTLRRFGLTLAGGGKPSSKDYARAFRQAAKHPNKLMLTTLLLRSLSQAVYKSDNAEGHFGLGYPSYTHFTSPIRRYPDLLVHRIIRAVLHAQPDTLPGKRTLQHAAMHCSMTERRADDATRDAVSWLKCEFMLDKIGQDYHGTITGVTSFGFFVLLDEVYVEGLVHVSTLKGDYYQFDSDHYRLAGKRGAGNVYQLGDKVHVQVAGVNLDDRKIDFVLFE